MELTRSSAFQNFISPSLTTWLVFDPLLPSFQLDRCSTWGKSALRRRHVDVSVTIDRRHHPSCRFNTCDTIPSGFNIQRQKSQMVFLLQNNDCSSEVDNELAHFNAS